MPIYKFPTFSGSIHDVRSADARKNVHLQFMLVSKEPGMVAQAGGTLFRCRIADNSGEMGAIFYDEVGLSLKVGDVLQLKEGLPPPLLPLQPSILRSINVISQQQRARRVYHALHAVGQTGAVPVRPHTPNQHNAYSY
jgi:hypothetical protein